MIEYKIPCDCCVHREVCLYKKKYIKLLSELRDKFNEAVSSDEDNSLKNFKFINPACNFSRLGSSNVRGTDTI